MRNDRYVLDSTGKPVPEPDLLKWAAWFGTAERIVAREHVGRALISTVFLGLDHSFGGDTPVLWETMVFCGPPELDHASDRCSGSREQAEAMHSQMVERVKASLQNT